MSRLPALLLLTALASACAAPTAVQGPVAPVSAGPVRPFTAVLGANAASLIAAFGKPELDLREGTGRKLQFATPICVLDAYLYPQGSEPVVRHIDTRQRSGGPIDQASCVAALRAARARR